MNDDALQEAMANALVEAMVDLHNNRVSVLGESVGLADDGIIRLTIDDVARICARVAHRAAAVERDAETET